MRNAAFVAFALLGTIASAQNSTTPQMGGWGAASSYNMLYKPESEVTITGTVTGVAETNSPAQGMTPVTTILVKSPNGGTSTVDLGPTWYLNNLGTPVKLNDTVSITGSKVTLNDRSFIMARMVSKGTHGLYLRERSGFPLWVVARGPLPPTTPKNSGGVLHHGGIDADVKAYVPVSPPQANNATQPTQTISGSVQGMSTVTNPQTGQAESVMLVNTPNGVMSLDLGPQWFAQQQAYPFATGNTVVAQASPYFQLPNSPTQIFIANPLTYGNQVFMFRTPSGYPVWSPFGP